jgi:hypothetical protein
MTWPPKEERSHFTTALKPVSFPNDNTRCSIFWWAEQKKWKLANQIEEQEADLFPGAKLIEAWREGGWLDGHGITTYKPPSLVKVKARSAPKEEQMMLNLH